MSADRLSVPDVAALALRRIEDPDGVVEVMLTLDRHGAIAALGDALGLLAALVEAQELKYSRVAEMLAAVPADAPDDLVAPVLGDALDKLWTNRLDARAALQQLVHSGD